MTITDAVERTWADMTKTAGRTSRRQFVLFTLHSLTSATTVILATMIAGMYDDLNPVLAWAILILVPTYLIALAVAQLTLTIRRLHDAGVSGWWTIGSVVPVFALGVLMIGLKGGDEGPNRWGDAL